MVHERPRGKEEEGCGVCRTTETGQAFHVGDYEDGNDISMTANSKVVISVISFPFPPPPYRLVTS